MEFLEEFGEEGFSTQRSRRRQGYNRKGSRLVKKGTISENPIGVA
jgi:hypothetical protein